MAKQLRTALHRKLMLRKRRRQTQKTEAKASNRKIIPDVREIREKLTQDKDQQGDEKVTRKRQYLNA